MSSPDSFPSERSERARRTLLVPRRRIHELRVVQYPLPFPAQRLSLVLIPGVAWDEEVEGTDRHTLRKNGVCCAEASGSIARPVGRRGGTSLDYVYRRYGRYVAAVVLRLYGRREELEDTIQDVFVEAASGIRGLRHPEAIKGWLATIAVRVVRRRLRIGKLRRFLRPEEESSGWELADPTLSPADRVLAAAVYRYLDQVPVNDRLAFTLHCIEGENVERVAALCECSAATAKRRIARVRAAVEARFSDG